MPVTEHPMKASFKSSRSSAAMKDPAAARTDRLAWRQIAVNENMLTHKSPLGIKPLAHAQQAGSAEPEFREFVPVEHHHQ
jgi:hypothetical protein